MVLEETYTISEIDLAEANVALKSNGIAYVFFKDNTEINVELQVRLIEVYDKITNRKPTPFVFFAGDDVTITKEARNNASLLADKSPLNATAIVINNLAYKIIANFYMKFNKPKQPYKIFKNEKEAIKWLKQFVVA